jgi:hypothetical protein
MQRGRQAFSSADCLSWLCFPSFALTRSHRIQKVCVVSMQLHSLPFMVPKAFWPYKSPSALENTLPVAGDFSFLSLDMLISQYLLSSSSVASTVYTDFMRNRERFPLFLSFSQAS